MSTIEHPPQLHVPVLLKAAIDTINPIQGESYLDLTAGYGGHATAFLNKTKNYSDSVLIDRDSNSINYLSELNLGTRLINSDFVSASRQLIEEGKCFDIVFVDLGVSSPQLDQDQRGFSFLKDGPLDMRMDPRQDLTASKLLNKLSQTEIAKILVEYGEEKPNFASRIATAIVRERPILTTKQLADIVVKQYRGKWSRLHPATRTFQALRIVVNDELGQIKQLLPLLPKLLNYEGRVGIISFHSLEDRLVKRYLKDQDEAGYESVLKIVNKKTISGATEDVSNPRARSAKLRVAVKIKK